MGKFTQHGYGPRDKMEAFLKKPIFGTVSLGKAFNAAAWFFAGASAVSLIAAMNYLR